MSSASAAVQILTCLLGGLFLPVLGQGSTCCPQESCCSNTCDSPTPYNITLTEFVGYQPFYIQLLPATPPFAGIDNACFTYILLPDGTYLMNLNVTYSNGFVLTQELIQSQQGLGQFPLGSATCNAELFMINYLKDCDVTLAYQCLNYGDCFLNSGDGVPLMAFSKINDHISQECVETAIAAISKTGVPSQEYFVLPGNLNSSCIKQLPCCSTSCA